MWKHTQYIRRGLNHVSAGTPCQDSVLVKEDDYGIVAALSDGLGSLENSQIAAGIVTQTAAQVLLEQGSERLLQDTETCLNHFRKRLLAEITTRIRNEAQWQNLPVNTMDCTMAFVYLSKVHNYAALGILGDSAICILGQQPRVFTDGNATASSTSAVMDKDAYQQLKMQIIDLSQAQIQGFLLTSDGLSKEVYVKNSDRIQKAAERYFNTLLEPKPETALQKLVDDLVEREPITFDDDISIAVVSCAQEKITLEEDLTWLCRCGHRNPLVFNYCGGCNADFLEVYQNVRFKPYGGKNAFFMKMNQDPETERAMVMPAAQVEESIPEPEEALPEVASPVVVEPEVATPVEIPVKKKERLPKKAGTVATSPEPRQEKPRKKKNSFGMLVLGLVLGVVLSAVVYLPQLEQKSYEVSSLLGRVNAAEKQAETMAQSLSAAEEAAKTLEEQLGAVPENFLALEDGKFYWGQQKDGQPEGKGILFDGTDYYIGNFQAGKRKGTHVVVSGEQPDQSKKVVFYNDALEQYAIGKKQTNLLREPDEDSKSVKKLSPGTAIQLIDGWDVEIDGVRWLQVQAGKNKGWIQASAIVVTQSP